MVYRGKTINWYNLEIENARESVNYGTGHIGVAKVSKLKFLDSNFNRDFCHLLLSFPIQIHGWYG